MLEVQALCNDRSSTYDDEEGNNSGGGMVAPAVRTAVGLKFERMQLLLAVLAKFVLGRRVQRNDIFVNVVGGLKLDDPSTDVAVAMAIASSFLERPLPSDMCFLAKLVWEENCGPLCKQKDASQKPRRWVSNECSCPLLELTKKLEENKAWRSSSVTLSQRQ